MSILHLSYSSSGGGAANAAFLLHQQLSDAGIQSYFRQLGGYIDQSGFCSTNRASRLARKCGNLSKHYASRALLALQRDSNFHWHSLSCFPSTLDIELNKSPCEVLHLHWVQSEFISIEAIGRLRKKIVWTLHDSWPYCGSEHHLRNTTDDRFRVGYNGGNRDKNASGPDLDRWCWERKMASWDTAGFTFIAPSSWSLNQARESRLLRDADIRKIPNIVDDTFFSVSRDSSDMRQRLGISEKASIITLGSAYVATDKNKGLELAETILRECMSETKDSVLILFGVAKGLIGSIQDKYSTSSQRVIVLPYLEKRYLAEIFAISDLVVVPSRLESFGLVAAEAQACGTPIVAYRTSGLVDVVQDGVTGVLAEAFNEISFVQAIKDLAHKPEALRRMGRLARERAHRLFSSRIVVSQHALVYSDLISNR